VYVYSRLLTPVEALVTTDAVSSHHDHHHHHHQQQQQQHDDTSDCASVDDAASEISDDETASVIEVEVASTDHWSAVNTDQTRPPTSSSLPSNDNSLLANSTEYIETAPWRYLPVRHRASIASYSDPDIASSAAAVSDIERQRLARARQRRHLARSTNVSQTQLIPHKSSLSEPALSLVTTTVNNDKQRQHGAVVVARSSYVPQKPPPPLPMPENELMKNLRPVQLIEPTTKPSLLSSSSSSSREQQKPVRELIAQLGGQMENITTTTDHQQQQQLRRQQRRQQLLLHRPLSSSSSDAEADYEILINTPPAAVTTCDNNNDKLVSYLAVSASVFHLSSFLCHVYMYYFNRVRQKK